MRVCKHCGDDIKDGSKCSHCKADLAKLEQCTACHMELEHGKIMPDPIDVRDPKTSLVDDSPPVPRPTQGFDEPAAVHEGTAGTSLADGWAMLNGYENAKDKWHEGDKDDWEDKHRAKRRGK